MTEEDVARVVSANTLVESDQWNEKLTANQVINNLGQFVLNSTQAKAFECLIHEAIPNSKRTLEVLLARNGAHSLHSLQKKGEARIGNKNYTVDASGRVCLVKTDDKRSNHNQELLYLQSENRALLAHQKELMCGIELAMQEHRKMMTAFVKNANDKPTNSMREKIERVLAEASEEERQELAETLVALDYVMEKEEKRSELRKKMVKYMEIERCLMKSITNAEDIRDVTKEDLSNAWRKARGKSMSEPASESATEEKSTVNAERGDADEHMDRTVL